eukprot:3224595-Pyramimonas_sp.AAC.1
MRAPVPASLPQSSAMGEHLSAAFVPQVADRPCQVQADLAGVIKLADKAKDLQLRSETPLLRECRTPRAVAGWLPARLAAPPRQGSQAWGRVRSAIS